VSGIFDAGKHILTLELRVGGEDIRDVISSAEVSEDGFHADASATDDGSSVADFRVDLNSLSHWEVGGAKD